MLSKKIFTQIDYSFENLNKTLEVGHYNLDRTGTFLNLKVRLR